MHPARAAAPGTGGARDDVHRHRHQAEHHEVQTGPRHRQAIPAAHPAPKRHQRTPRRAAPVGLVDPAVEQSDVQPARTSSRSTISAPNAATMKNTWTPSSRGGARRDERDAVGESATARDAADQRGAADPAHRAGHDGDHDHAEQRDAEPPADAVASRRPPRRSRSTVCPGRIPPGQARGCPRCRELCSICQACGA